MAAATNKQALRNIPSFLPFFLSYFLPCPREGEEESDSSLNKRTSSTSTPNKIWSNAKARTIGPMSGQGAKVEGTIRSASGTEETTRALASNACDRSLRSMLDLFMIRTYSTLKDCRPSSGERKRHIWQDREHIDAPRRSCGGAMITSKGVCLSGVACAVPPLSQV